MSADDRAPATASPSDLPTLLSKIATVVAPTTVLAALMFYFGWVRTQAYYALLGIDADDLQLSNTDYIIRSAPALWPSLVVGAAACVVALVLDRVVSSRLRRSARLRRHLLWWLLGVGVTLLIVCAVAVAQPTPQDSPGWALGLAAGFTVVAYAARVAWRITPGRPVDAARVNSERGVFALLGLLVVLSLFWATSVFADSTGQQLALRLEHQHFDSRPDVIVYSASRLHVDARDVSEQDFGTQYGSFRYRYLGFKLLARSAGKFVLIPYSWSPSNPYSLVLPDSPGVALVFAPNV